METAKLVEGITRALATEVDDDATVEIRETHMSWVFLTEKHAYKLKKPVKLPHLDFSTAARRRHFCEEEDRLNRRLAADTYLGVVAVYGSDEAGFGFDRHGPAVDWLVKMKRLSAEKMLDRRIENGSVQGHAIEHLAQHLASFYRALPAEQSAGATVIHRLKRELAIDRRVLLDPRFEIGNKAETLASSAESALEILADEIGARAARGRIIEGHGDLRPEHVWLGEPLQIIDCLEFNRELRLLDSYDEVRGLGMECAVLGARWVSDSLLAGVVRHLGDPPSPELMACYAALRGLTRARLCVAHLLETPVRKPQKWRPLAARYLDEAERACVSLPAR